MIDFKEVSFETDDWELFARDFFSKSGFQIESSPDRGADGGKDLLIIESFVGITGSKNFRWLVSCKNNAMSGKSVNESDEPNILERVESFKANGFIGFYSTIPSAGLNTRLRQLAEARKLDAYKIYDAREIERKILTAGYDYLVKRYMPISYRIIRPLHNIVDEYIPINCSVCDKDLLLTSYYDDDTSDGIFIQAVSHDGGNRIVHESFCSCKGECDKEIQHRVPMQYKGATTSWSSLSDMLSPNGFMRFVCATINQLSDPYYKIDPKCLKYDKNLIIACAQAACREVSEADRDRVLQLMKFQGL